MASGSALSLLRVLWGSLSPPGAGPWYLLLALRLLALSVARGAWPGPPRDLLCAWIPPAPPAPPGLRRLCAVLCHNRHLPTPMAALWSLSFLLGLLPVALLRLLRPHGRPKMAAEEGDRPKMADEEKERPDEAAGRPKMAAEEGDRSDMADGHANMAAEEGDCRYVAAGWPKMAARGVGRPKMATGQHDVVVGRANMAAGHANMAAEEGDRCYVAAGCHKMAARGVGCPKMAAGQHDVAVGRANMAARCVTLATRRANMAAGHANMAAEEGDRPYAAAGCPKMAARGVGRPKMAAGGVKMAALEGPTAKMEAEEGVSRPKMAEGRVLWRAWLWVGSAAILAAGEGGVLWAVLGSHLPAAGGHLPIGCRPPGAGPAPCPPLACALPAHPDKMAALVGVAASSAASLLANMAAAATTAARARRGRGLRRAGLV